MKEILKRTGLFKNMSIEEITNLLSDLDSKVYKYGKEEMILKTGEVNRKIALVIEGVIHITKFDYLGNLSLIAIIKPGELFGESYALTDGEKLGVSAVSETESTVLFIDVEKFNDEKINELDSFKKFNRNLMYILANKNIQMSKKLDHLTKRSIREKVVSYLSQVSIEAGSSSFEIPLNRQQMADYLCIDRSALSRELMNLKSENKIDYYKNEFKLK